MFQNKQCLICKGDGLIPCNQCSSFFCSKNHLIVHKNKSHRSISANPGTKNKLKNEFSNENINMNQLNDFQQNTRKNIISKMSEQKFPEAIDEINKCINISKQFMQEDNPFIIELYYSLSECYLNLSNLEKCKNCLEAIILFTDNNFSSIENLIFRQKANMLLGAISLNLGEYNNALKSYISCETELPKICQEPELNVKLSAVYLNIGLCYIYLGNKNIAEKYLKKGLGQTEGILGNDTIHKLNADLFENLGVVYEMMNRYKDSLIYYKKSLKLKFNLYGEMHDEVLELQYKISSVYLSLKQFKEAEEILNSIIDLILKQKINNATQECIYRYAAYFYTFGVVLIKLNRMNNAKIYLSKSLEIIDGFLLPNDPLVININDLMKICDSKKMQK